MAKKMLLIDDEQYIRELYEEVLRDAGYEVDTAVDGEEGLRKAQNGGYSLILLDVMMPKLDGLGVLDGLTKNPPKIPNGPVILLTNLGDDPLLLQAKNKGVTAAITKAEVTPDQFLSAVKKFLGEAA